MSHSHIPSDSESLQIHLLDMGQRIYGDSILVRHRDLSILIDGGHKGDDGPSAGTLSLPQQLEGLLGRRRPIRVSLLVVTHCHSDHVGCLPEMVERGDLLADWALVADERLGFGHLLDEADGILETAPPQVATLVAALREDSRSELDDGELQEFLADAATVEQRYRDMLTALERAGTRLVRYGRDDPGELVAAFEDVGLEILGPDLDHLLICADAIRRFTQDAASDMVQRPADFGDDRILAAYRRLAGEPAADAAADRPGKGAALNNQSIVLRLEAAGRSALLPGDMQLAKAEVDGLDGFMSELRRTVAARAPYDFVKVAHHSSYNGLDEEVLGELAGSRCFAHCGGSGGTSHPHPRVLELLRRRRQELVWCRTDRNGLTTVRLGPAGVEIAPGRGRLDDFTPNRRDAAAGVPEPRPEPAAEPAPARVVVAGGREGTAGGGDAVEVIVKIPHVRTRVTVEIDVVPGADGAVTTVRPTAPLDRPPAPAVSLPELRLANGRRLPPLLFATHHAALARNVGQAEASHVLAAVRSAGHELLDDLPAAATAADCAPFVRQRLQALDRAGRQVQGVVILGGYDVVPSQRRDVLDRELRQRLDTSWDADDFIVWSDDVYGDYEGDGLPEVPVSRIPDGLSADLLFHALGAPGVTTFRDRFGVRNSKRPYADSVFEELPGRRGLIVSGPATLREVVTSDSRGDLTYFPLHGSDFDGTTFWGEWQDERPGSPAAFTIGSVPEVYSGVVLSGCCWGALCSERPAARIAPGQRAQGRAAAASIALAFLKAGATAFVGCTGSHYSPLQAPYGYFGEPMHREFWGRLMQGKAPARALFEAKIAYLVNVPYRSEADEHVAIERKIHGQFTCLGLGW